MNLGSSSTNVGSALASTRKSILKSSTYTPETTSQRSSSKSNVSNKAQGSGTAPLYHSNAFTESAIMIMDKLSGCEEVVAATAAVGASSTVSKTPHNQYSDEDKVLVIFSILNSTLTN